MPFVLEDRLLTLFDLPIQLPQTLLPPGAWIGAATIRLEEGQKLDLRWLQIYIAGIETSDPDDPCGTVGRNVVNPDFVAGSLVTVFLIKDWTPAATPWGQTVLDYLTCPSDSGDATDAVAPLYSVRDLTTPLEATGAGDSYTVVVLNNTTNRNVMVAVTGALTIDTDPL